MNYDIILRNGTIVDGSGQPAYTADVAICGGKIAAIGDLKDASAGRVIDASGKLVTPGFVDMHSHADLSIVQYPDAENLLGQGVTTAFCGHCGMGMAPVGEYWKTQNDDIFAIESLLPLTYASTMPGVTPVLPSKLVRQAYKSYFGIDMDWVSFGDYLNKLKALGTGVNLAMEVGFQQIRLSAMGPDTLRPATEKEIQHMEALIDEAMESGAYGLSFGLDYTPDRDASDEELTRAAARMARHGGILAAHTRNAKKDAPNWFFIDGLKEVIELGGKVGAPTHLSHIYAGFRVTPMDSKLCEESAKRTLEIFDEYRARGFSVSWDTLNPDEEAFYHYPELCSCLMYYLLTCGGKQAFREKLDDKNYYDSVAARVAAGEHIVFPRFETNAVIRVCKNASYLNKSIEDLAKEHRCSPAEMLLKVLMDDMDTIIQKMAKPTSLYHPETYWKHDDATIGLDNPASNYDYPGHMRPELPVFFNPSKAYCGMIHFILRSKDMPIEKTIQKLTGNPAKALNFTDRGLLREGMQADINVLDYEKLATNGSFIEPRQKPSGVEYVIVNGKVAVDHGVHSHVRSGAILKRQ